MRNYTPVNNHHSKFNKGN